MTVDLLADLERTVASWRGVPGVGLSTPASFEAVVSAEEAIGLPLPPALRVMLSLSDGISYAHGKVAMLPCDQAMANNIVTFNDVMTWRWAYTGINDLVDEFLFIERNWHGNLVGYRREDLERGGDPDPELFLVVPRAASDPIPLGGGLAEISLRQPGDAVMQLSDHADLALHRRFGEVSRDHILLPGMAQLLTGVPDPARLAPAPLVEGLIGLADLTRHRDELPAGTPVRGVDGHVDVLGRRRLRWRT